MECPIKFLSLQKSELEYEVTIRGETPGTTVEELRKQITKLAPLYPSEDILDSSMKLSQDLKGVSDVLAKVRQIHDSKPDKNAVLRAQNYLHHLYHRLNRLDCGEQVPDLYNVAAAEFQELYKRNKLLRDTAVDSLLASSPTSPSNQLASTPINITVSCERGVAGELTRIKFDGKSCVRAFIQRISEFSTARNISSSKLLSYATEIFTGDALHWYRGLQGQVSDWDELVSLLKNDFDQADFDYRLLSEIRARTQGETENITIYLSIMSGLFSRLSKSLSNEDKLEILLHNIRPCYASTLASAANIDSIDALRSLCRNYENIQARLAGFREPPKVTSETMAPEFAYSGHSPQRPSSYNINSDKNNNNNSKGISNSNKNVHAMSTTPKAPYCPRCRNNTHNLRQCKANKDKILCFVCGHEGVKTPQCPTCKKNKAAPSKNQ